MAVTVVRVERSVLLMMEKEPMERKRLNVEEKEKTDRACFQKGMND